MLRSKTLYLAFGKLSLPAREVGVTGARPTAAATTTTAAAKRIPLHADGRTRR